MNAALRQQVSRLIESLPYTDGGMLRIYQRVGEAVTWVAKIFACPIEDATDYIAECCRRNYTADHDTANFFRDRRFVTRDEEKSLEFYRKTETVGVSRHPLFKRCRYPGKDYLAEIRLLIVTSRVFRKGQFPTAGFIVVHDDCGPVRFVPGDRGWEGHVDRVTRFSQKKNARLAIERYGCPGTAWFAIVEVKP